MKNIRKEINKILNLYTKKKEIKKFHYPLLDDAFSNDDIIKAIEVLFKKQLTMGDITRRFEYEFAKFMKSKYALMVNSGSSANLLAAFALVNPRKKNHLKRNDEFIIQSLSWSTSLWPMIQAGLKPKFVDVTMKNFNINIESLKSKISSKTKAIMLVHVLGCSSNIQEIKMLAKKNNIYLVEDTCESLGAKFNKKYLGTFGDFGTYSFYYSHQITSAEGGMIICNSKEDYEIINSLRAHGWDRGINKKNNKSFNFINSGFNVRPLDITAAIGLNQFKRLNKFKLIRNQNRIKIIEALKNAKFWKDQLSFTEYAKNQDPSWFGLPILINKKLLYKKKKYLKYLNKLGIETRPILSGNFMNQPSIKLFNLNPTKEKFYNAQEIDERGFFIGLHTKPLSNENLKILVRSLLTIK